ncbi:hypothetical protein F2Q70_00042593 [Brassica cretica]|uniref:Uncharacterized protein n=1 Tax=Brassica cretica TaxID=69181 RepID=A0A8S9KGI4_BRACR|nr:hypothetical protein F2Q70_00042593 [Brassica cretica]
MRCSAAKSGVRRTGCHKIFPYITPNIDPVAPYLKSVGLCLLMDVNHPPPCLELQDLK